MMEPMAEVAPAPYDWSGFYAGLSAGKSSGDFGFIFQDTGAEYLTTDINGNSTGLFAGYNFQNGNFVYGVELAINKLNAEFEYAPVLSIEDPMDLKFRVGYAWDDLLLYGFAGATRANYNYGFLSTDYDINGTNFGLGVDWGMTDNWLIGVEYIDRQLDGDYAGDFDEDTRADFSTVQLRVGYKF